MFSREDKKLFEERLQQSKNLQRQAEDERRFEKYVREYNYKFEMPNPVLKNILAKIASTKVVFKLR